MSRQDMDAPITAREAMGYFKRFHDEFNKTLQDIPTKAEIDELKREGFEMWRQWQQDIQNRLDDIPTRQDLLAMREEEGRLRKHLRLAISIIGLLVGVVIVHIVRPTFIAEATGEKNENLQYVHNTYAVGTLGNNWFHNQTNLQFVSSQEGWVFLQYPIEYNMSTFPGDNNYILQDKEAAKFQLDESLYSINIKSATELNLFVHYGRQSDATFVIPADKCSYNYIIPMHEFDSKSMGKIGLFTPHKDTQVTITFRQDSGLVTFNNRLYGSGESTSVYVARRQILTIAHNVSLAGTTIQSTEPVCVIAGAGCTADMPECNADKPGCKADKPGCKADKPGCNADKPGCKADKPGCNADKPGYKPDKPGCKSVITTVLPSNQLSRTFIVPNCVRKWSLLQMVSPEDKNRVVIELNGNKVVLGASTAYNIDLVGDKPMVVTSDQDLVVTVLARPTRTDPFLLWVVGIDQYRSSYQFYIPYYADKFIHELYVICNTKLKDDLRLNNKLLYPLPDSKRLISVGSEEYVGFRVSIQCCITYVMEHKNMGTFGLYIFGYLDDSTEASQYASFGYPAGIYLH